MNELAGAQDLNERLAVVAQAHAGMWNCCQARPSKAIKFYDEDGATVWVQACAACASTVPTDRRADLRRLVDAEREDGRALALEAAARAVTSEQWYRALALGCMAAMVLAVVLALVLSA